MSAPYAECDLVAIVENYTIPRFTPLFIEAMVHGFLDGILNLPADSGVGLTPVGAGSPAPSEPSRSLGAHSPSAFRPELTKEGLA